MTIRDNILNLAVAKKDYELAARKVDTASRDRDAIASTLVGLAAQPFADYGLSNAKPERFAKIGTRVFKVYILENRVTIAEVEIEEEA